MKDLNRKYQKCGDLYIKFDDQGVPEYGFEVRGAQIRKFYNLKNDKEPKKIILPPVSIARLKSVLDDETLKDIEQEIKERGTTIYTPAIARYIEGYVDIADECFCDLRDKEIIIKTNYPIAFGNEAFNNCQNISFVLPNNQIIYNAHETHNGAFDYEHFDWYLIGSKNLPLKQLQFFGSRFTVLKSDLVAKNAVSTDSEDEGENK